MFHNSNDLTQILHLRRTVEDAIMIVAQLIDQAPEFQPLLDFLRDGAVMHDKMLDD
jgi:hypothetical protein